MSLRKYPTKQGQTKLNMNTGWKVYLVTHFETRCWWINTRWSFASVCRFIHSLFPLVVCQNSLLSVHSIAIDLLNDWIWTIIIIYWSPVSLNLFCSVGCSKRSEIDWTFVPVCLLNWFESNFLYGHIVLVLFGLEELLRSDSAPHANHHITKLTIYHQICLLKLYEVQCFCWIKRRWVIQEEPTIRQF